MAHVIGDRVIELRTSLHARVTHRYEEFDRLDIMYDGKTSKGDEVECPVLPDDIISEKPMWGYDEYSKWSKDIARLFTREEICKQLNYNNSLRKRLSLSHFQAVESSHSMTGNSQRRAQSRNSMVGNYEKFRAHKNALEIYCYYPEETKDYLIEMMGQ